MSSREQETERIIRHVDSIFDDLEKRRGTEFVNQPVVRVVRHLAGTIARLVAVLPEPDDCIRTTVGARVLRDTVEYVDQVLTELRSQKRDGGDDGNS